MTIVQKFIIVAIATGLLAFWSAATAIYLHYRKPPSTAKALEAQKWLDTNNLQLAMNWSMEVDLTQCDYVVVVRSGKTMMDAMKPLPDGVTVAVVVDNRANKGKAGYPKDDFYFGGTFVNAKGDVSFQDVKWSPQ
jgi:hypothetical protein